jgi:hypothetical protein
MRKVALGFVLALVLVAVGTYVAGEQDEVVMLRTLDDLGEPHDTELWVVDYDGAAWVRVARPERLWYQRLLADPRAQFVRAGVERDVVASPHEELRAELDAAFRAKYGAVDWWYGVLLREDAIPVRLDPVS